MGENASTTKDIGILVAEGLTSAGFTHGFGTRHFDVSGMSLIMAEQVHGAHLAWVDREGEDPGQADGLVTSRALSVAVRTADCVPILLADPGSGTVAAIHAGWRGTLAGIGREGVSTLVGAGARAEELIAAIGPCIGACCYEVSPELATEFADTFGEGVREGRRLDLRRANRLQLEAAGVALVEDVGGCTFCEGERFFSYRREGTEAGRQLSFIRGA